MSEYKIAVVRPFSSELGGETESLVGLLHTEAVRQLKASGLFTSVIDKGEAAPGQPTLVIDARIIDFEKGEKWKRVATIGGEAFAIVRMEIRSGDGQMLAAFNSRGFVKDALTGGDVKDAVPLICSGLVNFIKERSSAGN